MKILKDKLKTLSGDFKSGGPDAVDPVVVAKARDYKRRVASRLVALGKEDIATRLFGKMFIVSRKLDGEFNCLIYEENEAFLCKPSGVVLYGLPCLQEAAALLHRAGVVSACIAGELHFHKSDDSRSRVFDVLGASRSPKNADEAAALHFAPFDIVELNNKPFLAESYEQILAKLTAWFGSGQKIKPVANQAANSREEVAEIFRQWVEEEDAEGLVVRTEGSLGYKIKPRHTIDAVVIGYVEGIDDRKGMVKSFLTALMRENGLLQILGSVGTGFSTAQRTEFLTKLQAIPIDSEYLEVDRDAFPYKMVRPEMVIEISFVDLLSMDNYDKPFLRMVLSQEDNTYKIVQRLPFVSMIYPTFVRLRDDKQAVPEDIRISQVAELVSIDRITDRIEKTPLPEAAILQREVYTKNLKGKLAVRKFLVWKTNKEMQDSSYPAYVTVYSDFSADRAEPLQREVRISNDYEQILVLAAQFRSENIKKGWEKVTV